MMVLLLQSAFVNNERRLVSIEQKVEANINHVTQIQHEMQGCVDSLRKDIQSGFNERDEKIVSASNKIENLEKQLREFQLAADEQDAYIRRDSLIFSGNSIPVFTEGEDCTQIVRKIIREKLKLNLDPMMSTAHRLGKPPLTASNKPDKRDIIVRFCQRDMKYRVYEATRKAKINGLYANESLTPTRRKIHQALLSMKRNTMKVP